MPLPIAAAGAAAAGGTAATGGSLLSQLGGLGGLGSLLGGLGGFFQGGQDRSVVPSDVTTIQSQRLGGASAEEELLAQLQQQLAQQLFSQAFQGTGGITAQSLAQGQLSGQTNARLQEIAFGGLEEAGRRALSASAGQTARQGIPGSSVQASLQAQLLRPELQRATQQFAGLQQQELLRQQQLRQQALQNMQVIQQSPALQRLLQLRLAEATQIGSQRTAGQFGQAGVIDFQRGGVPGLDDALSANQTTPGLPRMPQFQDPSVSGSFL